MGTAFRFSCAPPDSWLRIEGELDVSSRGPLAWRLFDVEQLDCSVLQVDVSAVTHIDTCCMRLINDSRERMVARGGRFELVAASPSFALMARLAGFTTLAKQAELSQVTSAQAPRLRAVPGRGVPRPVAG